MSVKPWLPENVLRLFCVLLVLLSIGGIVAQVLGLGNAAEHASWSKSKFLLFTTNLALFHIVTLGCVGWFLKEQRLTWKEAFGLRCSGLGSALVASVLVVVLALPCSWILIGLSSWVMELFTVPVVAQEAVQTLQRTQSWQERALFCAVAVILAPVVEEVLFRGILYPTVKQAGFPRIATWGTALFFAATHANLMTFAALAVFAAGLALLYERTDNLLAPIVSHALFNALNFVWLVRQG